MHAFDVLGDPVRRRILELIADGEMASGAVCDVVRHEFGISQPAVSQHLKVLRDAGFATVRAEGTRRLYAVQPGPLRDVDAWLDRFRRFWTPPMEALATEIARGRRERRDYGNGTGDQASATGDQGSATGDQGSATGDQGSATGDQASGSGDHGSGTG